MRTNDANYLYADADIVNCLSHYINVKHGGFLSSGENSGIMKKKFPVDATKPEAGETLVYIAIPQASTSQKQKEIVAKSKKSKWDELFASQHIKDISLVDAQHLNFILTNLDGRFRSDGSELKIYDDIIELLGGSSNVSDLEKKINALYDRYKRQLDAKKLDLFDELIKNFNDKKSRFLGFSTKSELTQDDKDAILESVIESRQKKQTQEEKDSLTAVALELKDKDGRVRILAPYHIPGRKPEEGHWQTFEINIESRLDVASGKRIFVVNYTLHDPLLGKPAFGKDTQDLFNKVIIERLSEQAGIDKANIQCQFVETTYVNSRQPDRSSCGPIAVEEILLRAQGIALRDTKYSEADIATIRLNHRTDASISVLSPRHQTSRLEPTGSSQMLTTSKAMKSEGVANDFVAVIKLIRAAQRNAESEVDAALQRVAIATKEKSTFFTRTSSKDDDKAGKKVTVTDLTAPDDDVSGEIAKKREEFVAGIKKINQDKDKQITSLRQEFLFSHPNINEETFNKALKADDVLYKAHLARVEDLNEQMKKKDADIKSLAERVSEADSLFEVHQKSLIKAVLSGVELKSGDENYENLRIAYLIGEMADKKSQLRVLESLQNKAQEVVDAKANILETITGRADYSVAVFAFLVTLTEAARTAVVSTITNYSPTNTTDAQKVSSLQVTNAWFAAAIVSLGAAGTLITKYFQGYNKEKFGDKERAGKHLEEISGQITSLKKEISDMEKSIPSTDFATDKALSKKTSNRDFKIVGAVHLDGNKDRDAVSEMV